MTVVASEVATPDALPAAGTGAPARRVRPTSRLAIHPAWVIVVCAAALLVRASMHLGLGTDVFWHLAAGNWMLAHHQVIRHDVFSYTVRGRPWLAEEWGFEVLLAEMVRHLGAVSYWLLSGVCCAGALLVSAARWRRMGASATWIAALACVTTAGLLIGLAARPQDLSYLFFAAELLLLSVARRRRRALAAIPVLLGVWANIHGSFLLGLVVLALELAIALAAGAGWRPAPSSRLALAPLRRADAAGALVAGTAATLLNPHGVNLLAYAVRVTTAAPLAAIEEWQSPNFHSPLIVMGIAVPILLVVTALATTRRRVNLFDLVLWSGCLLATLHAVRFAPYLAIAEGGLAATWHLPGDSGVARWRLSAPLALLCAGGLLVGPHLAPGSVAPGSAPVAAVNWLAGRSGRIFSTYDWNDYLISRDIPVFVDGRTDLYFGTHVLSSYEAVALGTERPDPLLARWRVRWVLWPAYHPLSVYLAEDRSWRLVRRFGTTEIFERRSKIG